MPPIETPAKAETHDHAEKRATRLCPTQESGVTVNGCLEFTFSPTGP